MSLAAATTPATTPATTAPLTVEVTVSVGVEETVDLVALFRRMDVRAQKRYFALDPAEYSIGAEWERPVAYLWPDEDDLLPLSLVPGNRSHPRGDINDSDVRVQHRDGERVYGRDARWTEQDYLRLASLVPWLAATTDNDTPANATTQSDAAPVDQALTVEVTATFGVTETVDLCALFASMSQRERLRYFDLDLTEVGFDAEWERPMAYLWPDEDDLLPHTMIPGSGSPLRGHVEDSDMRVIKRHDKTHYGPESRWSEDDYLTLADHVPWLKQHILGETMSEHDRARMPGPNDVPLFG